MERARDVNAKRATKAVATWLAPSLAALLMVTSASAQAPLVPTLVRSREPADLGEYLALWSRERNARGERALESLELTQRFERGHSAPAEQPSVELLDLHAACVQELMGFVAEQRFAAATETAERCQRMMEESIALLNRETRSAEQVLDGCLFVVRAILEAAGRAGGPEVERRAIAQGRECRRRVPDLAVSPNVHTQEVRAIMARVDAELARNQRTLRVTGAQEGCSLYLNGRRLGTTPFARRGMPPGTYTVQIQCDRPSRIYRVELVGNEAEVHIDPRFEAVFSSRPFLALRYDSEQTETARRLQDDADVARGLSTDELWLLSVESDGSHRIDRWHAGESRVLASVWLTPSNGGYLHSAIGPAIEALHAGQSVDLREPIVRTMAAWTPLDMATSQDQPSDRFDPLPHILGASALGTLGVGLALAAGILWLDFDATCTGSGAPQDDMRCHPLPREDGFLRMVTVATPLGIIGTSAFLAATGWLLGAIAEDATAWYVAGGVAAAGTLATLVAMLISDATENCLEFTSNGFCKYREVFPAESVAGLATLSGILAAASTAYFMLGATDGGDGPRLQAGVGLGSFSLMGNF